MTIEEIKNKIFQGDVLEVLSQFPDESVDCVVTSPPYWNLRDYGVTGQFGIERTFQEYVTKLCDIFDEVKRVLKQEGTCWLNLGDTYAGNKVGNTSNKISNSVKDTANEIKKVLGDYTEKSLVMIPERVAVEMIERGWVLRNKIIWHKKNAMPSSVTDRLSNTYELVYFFTKNKMYYFDLDAIRIPYESFEQRPQGVVRAREYGYNTKLGTKRRDMEENARTFNKRRPPKENGTYIRNPKGKNPGDVWTLTLQPHKDNHIAMFPEKLIAPMIKAGCPKGGIVCDIFMGSGTTAYVARKLGRNYVGIELNPEYIKLAEKRLAQQILI